MQINYKRTFFVGLAFLSICSFWQMYDNVIPLILQNSFSLKDTVIGAIMSLDNILAIILLPIIGTLSDKVHTPFGKRTPFIIGGTLCAILFMFLMPIAAHNRSLPLFIIGLFLTLLSMAMYRSPAVALMPDITPKPLRSKANAVINLMGAFGGVYALLMIKFLIPKEVKRTLILILVSVALWFTAYNAVTTAFSRYAQKVWHIEGGGFANCLMVATVVAILSYLPIGMISTKIGRKRTILCSLVLMFSSYCTAMFYTSYHFTINIFFGLIGFAWAAISVNSYPMVVELGHGSNIGKYTGFYYTFSMLAQIITPILSGALLQYFSYKTLFPYAMIFTALAFLTMTQVRHGNTAN